MRAYATGVLLTLALVQAGVAAAFELRTDSEGDVVKWRDEVAFTVEAALASKLRVTGADSALSAALTHFAGATPAVRLSSTSGDALPIGYVIGGPNTNSILVLEDWPYAAGALGVTFVTLNARTNEVLDADIGFNIEEHDFTIAAGPGPHELIADDVQNTFSHELGHALGLMHSSVAPDLVMYPSAQPGETCKRVLKADDLAGLTELYGRRPSSPSPLPLTPGAPVAPAGWGCWPSRCSSPRGCGALDGETPSA